MRAPLLAVGRPDPQASTRLLGRGAALADTAAGIWCYYQWVS